MSDPSFVSAQRVRWALEQPLKAPVVVAAIYTSARCPWCIALKKEQLGPRTKAQTGPGLIVVEFDIDDGAPFSMPDGSRTTARAWGQRVGLRLTPTVVMLDHLAKPLTEPLVGYSSRDFYAVYLEQQIEIAQRFWQNRKKP